MSAADVVEVLDQLEGVGVVASVAGGWAVDALLGHPSREHGDLTLRVRFTE